jgi:hypothetical protein
MRSQGNAEGLQRRRVDRVLGGVLVGQDADKYARCLLGTVLVASSLSPPPAVLAICYTLQKYFICIHTNPSFLVKGFSQFKRGTHFLSIK